MAKLKGSMFFWLITSIIISSSLLAADFGYPINGEPWYFIKTTFPADPSLSGAIWEVKNVTINGQRVRDFILFQQGQELLAKEIKGSSPFEIKIRYPWEGNKDYEIQILLNNPKTKKQIKLSQKISSPDQKGYWNPNWKNYLSLIVAEEHNIERINYPIHATLAVLSKYFKSPDEIRVIKVEKVLEDIVYLEIPAQVYEVVNWDDQKLLSTVETDELSGERIVRYHPTTTFSLAFLANLHPNEKATYLIFYNNQAATKPTYASDLRVKGEGIGKTIENNYIRVTLNKKSGVIYEITEKLSRIRLEHKLETNGSIHWNPCVYSPPHAWYHTSDWENPPFKENVGPVFYSIKIANSLPFYPNVQASVTYYIYANSPYILVQTTINLTDSMFVQALRNGEVVFNKKVFNKAAYREMNGEVRIIDLKNTKMHPEHAVILRPDVPWVLFYNEEKNIVFANLYLETTNFNLEGGEASLQQPFVYIQNGPWYYLARGLVYSFGTNNQTRMLPGREGSVYYEKNIFYPYSFKKGLNFSAQAENLFRMMKYPLAVFENIETYPESPEKWVAPILTEPFEEGVKDAVGTKKK